MYVRPFMFGCVVAIAAAVPAAARPLDAQACAELRQQREALESAGARAALLQPAPERAVRVLDEQGQRMRKLIDVDGQLRFRCGVDLPIPSLKPELLVEMPDSVEGEAQTKRPPVKRRKVATVPRGEEAADGAKAGTQAGQAAVGVPAEQPKRRKTVARAQPAAEGDGNPAPSAAPKSRPKIKADDAYHPQTRTQDAAPDAPPSKSP